MCLLVCGHGLTFSSSYEVPDCKEPASGQMSNHALTLRAEIFELLQLVNQALESC